MTVSRTHQVAFAIRLSDGIVPTSKFALRRLLSSDECKGQNDSCRRAHSWRNAVKDDNAGGIVPEMLLSLSSRCVRLLNRPIVDVIVPVKLLWWRSSRRRPVPSKCGIVPVNRL